MGPLRPRASATLGIGCSHLCLASPPGCSGALRTTGPEGPPGEAVSLLLARQDEAQKTLPVLSELSLPWVTPKASPAPPVRCEDKDTAHPHPRPWWLAKQRSLLRRLEVKGVGPVPAGLCPACVLQTEEDYIPYPSVHEVTSWAPLSPSSPKPWRPARRESGCPGPPGWSLTTVGAVTQFIASRLQIPSEPWASEPDISASLPRSCS